jgi:hypothetical protein
MTLCSQNWQTLSIGPPEKARLNSKILLGEISLWRSLNGFRGKPANAFGYQALSGALDWCHGIGNGKLLL